MNNSTVRPSPILAAMRLPRFAVLLAGLGLLVCPIMHLHALKKLPAAQLTANNPFLSECDPWTPFLPVVTDLATAEPRDVLINLLMRTKPEDRRHETPIQFSLAYLRESALWDVMAPFHDTTKPLLAAATVPRQPATKRTNANMSTAANYVVLRLAEAWLPAAVPGLRETMKSWKLNPDDKSVELSTAAGIGNYVAAAWNKYAENDMDGFDRRGELANKHNRRPYGDYSAFVPQNDAYTLRNITAWQPLFETNGLG